MDAITKIRLLWMGNSIESLQGMVDENMFLENEVEGVKQTILALQRHITKIKNEGERVNVVEVLGQGKAEVIFEPRGDNGLEGYQLGDKINYNLVCSEETKKMYYRVWLDDWVDANYYETCGMNTFGTYFKKLETINI